MSVIILGVDPGLANTGWGVVETDGARFRCLGYGCIRTVAADDTAGRCKAVHDGLAGVIARFSPAEAAFENIYFNRNVQTAMATGQARGAALVAAADARLTVGEYGPGEIKLAVVGSGTADKRQITYMVRTILALDHDPEPDHAADALAAAICHANQRVARARAAEAGRAAGGAR
ncbi:MAG: crossover junction endodeoxyribonuclease RuvC [Coriobacteriia bacterium]|nr:crossover junction endodeoxyribonuclease RuvC [Coriobacteriia bacterium]